MQDHGIYNLISGKIVIGTIVTKIGLPNHVVILENPMMIISDGDNLEFPHDTIMVPIIPGAGAVDVDLAIYKSSIESWLVAPKEYVSRYEYLRELYVESFSDESQLDDHEPDEWDLKQAEINGSSDVESVDWNPNWNRLN
jgi:hypothetical protein